MEEDVEVSNVHGHEVYAESGKLTNVTSRAEEKRAFLYMHDVKAAGTQHYSLKVTKQHKTDVIQEEPRNSRVKEPRVRTTVADGHGVDDRHEVSRTPRLNAEVTATAYVKL